MRSSSSSKTTVRCTSAPRSGPAPSSSPSSSSAASSPPPRPIPPTPISSSSPTSAPSSWAPAAAPPAWPSPSSASPTSPSPTSPPSCPPSSATSSATAPPSSAPSRPPSSTGITPNSWSPSAPPSTSSSPPTSSTSRTPSPTSSPPWTPSSPPPASSSSVTSSGPPRPTACSGICAREFSASRRSPTRTCTQIMPTRRLMSIFSGRNDFNLSLSGWNSIPLHKRVRKKRKAGCMISASHGPHPTLPSASLPLLQATFSQPRRYQAFGKLPCSRSQGSESSIAPACSGTRLQLAVAEYPDHGPAESSSQGGASSHGRSWIPRASLALCLAAFSCSW